MFPSWLVFFVLFLRSLSDYSSEDILLYCLIEALLLHFSRWESTFYLELALYMGGIEVRFHFLLCGYLVAPSAFIGKSVMSPPHCHLCHKSGDCVSGSVSWLFYWLVYSCSKPTLSKSLWLCKLSWYLVHGNVVLVVVPQVCLYFILSSPYAVSFFFLLLILASLSGSSGHQGSTFKHLPLSVIFTVSNFCICFYQIKEISLYSKFAMSFYEWVLNFRNAFSKFINYR